MNQRRSRFTPAVSFVNETLEGRLLPSGFAFGSADAVAHSAAEVAARTVRAGATTTKLEVNAGTLGQPITFTAIVRAAARAGSPQGTVNIIDHGVVIQTLPLSPTTSTSARYAFSEATYTLRESPGAGTTFSGSTPSAPPSFPAEPSRRAAVEIPSP